MCTKKNIIQFLALLFFPFFSWAQTIETIEDDLLFSINRIDSFAYLSLRTDETAFDSLVTENVILKQKIIQYALANKEMLTFDFPKLKGYQFYKATSPDKTFCIFSWNLRTGGSMQFYDNVFVYQQYDKMYTKTVEREEGTPGGFYSEVFQLIFDFEKNNFDFNLKKIKTKAGYTNTLGFSYNFFSVVKHKERPIKLIYFNKTQQTITIPLVDINGNVTSKTIVYKYDGDYFLKQ